MTLTECCVTSDLLSAKWSNDDYEENFRESFRAFEDARDTRSGCAYLHTISHLEQRILHWESTEGVVCFRDVSCRKPLGNSAVCIHLGASAVLQIYVASRRQENTLSVSISIVQQDGNIHRLHLRAEDNVSILDGLVLAGEGRLLHLGGILTSEIPSMRLGGKIKENQLHFPSRNDKSSGETSVLVDFGLVQSLPADRDILCATWVSSELLVLGLSRGDALLVHLECEDGECNLLIGKRLTLREQLLKDRGGGLQALWSDFMGRVADANSDTIDIGASSSSLLAINRSGELRLWSVQTKQVIAHSFLYDLLDVVGATNDLLPHRVRSNATEQDVDKNIHLQECITRTVEVEDRTESGATYVVGAIAVLPEETTSNLRISQPASGAWGLVPESHLPLQQQSWRIYLLAWKESHGPVPSAAEAPKLIAQPIRFPIDSPVAAGEPGEHAFSYTAASLCDLQLAVDVTMDSATIISVWRAEASRIGAGGEIERVTLEGVVGRSVLTLSELRAQAFSPQRPVGTGPNALNNLHAPTAMELIARSPVYDGLRLRTEDITMHRLRMNRWRTSAADADLLSFEEKKLKVEMLRRIFLRRRFSRRAICAAHDAFRSKLKSRDDQVEREIEQVGGDRKNGHLLDSRTPLKELPRLVLDLCESAASVKFQEGFELLGATLGAGRTLERRSQYLHYLQDCFSTFLLECETATARFNRLHVGCVAGAVKGNAVQFTVARRGGDLSVIRNSDSLALKPCSREAQQARSLIGQVQRQFDSNEALATAFVELDCLLDSFFQEGDISTAGVMWIEQYFAALSPSLREIAPSLLSNLQAASPSQFSCLDAMVSFDAPQVLLDFAKGAFGRLTAVSSQRSESDTVRAVALTQDLTHVLRQRLHDAKLILSLLYLLKDVGHAVLCIDANAAVRDIYIPKAIHSLLHCSLILWLDTRLAASDQMLKNDVELAGTFPLSALLTQGKIAGHDQSRPSSSSPLIDCSMSVLENFVKHHCSHHDGTCAAESIFSALVPSVHCELSLYLFQAGQYVASAKWAALSRLCSIEQISGAKDDAEGLLMRIAPVLSDLRTHLAQLTAEYFELLRCQWFVLQGQVPSEGDSCALLQAIRSKGAQLLSVTRELGALAGDLMQGEGYLADSSLNSPNLSPQKQGIAVAEVATSFCASLYSLWEKTTGRTALKVFGMTVKETSSLSSLLDGLLALGDATQYVSGVRSQSASFLAALVSAESLPCVSNGADGLLLRQSSEFCTTMHLAGLCGVLEIIDRSLPFLPRELGASLALDGALIQVEQVTNALDLLAQSSSLDRSAGSQELVADLHGAWSRAFEYAVWHGNRYDQALEALLRMAELEEQRLVLSTPSSPGVTWRDSLRTLVSQACELGHLGWLCSIPDRQLLGYARRGFSLSEAVAATLEVLATTLDVPAQFESDVNYFECLYVYQLSRKNYHDAARIMHRYSERYSGRDDGAGLVAAALTALTVLPGDQEFLLHRASAAGQTSSGSSSVAPVREFDAQQLYLAFARKLAASKMLDPTGSIESSAVESTVLTLCNAAKLHAAISIAVAEDNAQNSAHTPLVEFAIIALAQRCVASPSPANENLYCKVRSDALLYAPYAFSCTPTAALEETGMSGGNMWWGVLNDLLLCVGRSGGERRSHLYETAVRALLAFHAADSAEDSPPHLQIPQTFLDVLSGCQAPNGNLSGCVGNPAALMRLLIEFGNLEDACLLAVKMIHQCNAQLYQGRDTSNVRTCLPYTLFDWLIDHCQQQLPRLRLSDHHDAIRLEVAFAEYLKVIEHHFSILVVA